MSDNYTRPKGTHPLPFKIGDRVVATRDACLSWNEKVKKGDQFTVDSQLDLRYMHYVPGFYRLVSS